MFDAAIIESGGNGGDMQIVGNDFAIVRNTENMVFLGLFGGNKEAVTKTKITEVQSFDFWGNNLFHPGDPSVQFNSLTEHILDITPVTSAGRVIIENTIKKDLEFFKEFGKYEVEVRVISDDWIKLIVKTFQIAGDEKITIVNLKKKATGDWFISDFNNDFYFGY